MCCSRSTFGNSDKTCIIHVSKAVIIIARTHSSMHKYYSKTTTFKTVKINFFFFENISEVETKKTALLVKAIKSSGICNRNKYKGISICVRNIIFIRFRNYKSFLFFLK